jgi:hypothetical protein
MAYARRVTRVLQRSFPDGRMKAGERYSDEAFERVLERIAGESASGISAGNPGSRRRRRFRLTKSVIPSSPGASLRFSAAARTLAFRPRCWRRCSAASSRARRSTVTVPSLGCPARSRCRNTIPQAKPRLRSPVLRGNGGSAARPCPARGGEARPQSGRARRVERSRLRRTGAPSSTAIYLHRRANPAAESEWLAAYGKRRGVRVERDLARIAALSKR